MTEQAVFRASYADWKLIKTRSTVQIVLEVPVERAGLAYEVLGGMPTPGNEVWCAVARLAETKESAAQPRPSSLPTTATGGAHSKKNWHDMSAAQQAGLLCGEQSFVNFLIANYKSEFNDTTGPASHFDRAAQVVRSLCGVTSRSLIDKHESAQRRWRQLSSDYRAWMREPEVVNG